MICRFEKSAYNASQSSFIVCPPKYTMKSSRNFSSKFSIHTPLFWSSFSISGEMSDRAYSSFISPGKQKRRRFGIRRNYHVSALWS